MAILIKDPATDRLVRQLAERTGETLTETVKTAVAEKLRRMPLSDEEVAERKRKLKELLAKFDAMPTVDNRTADEIIGYNEFGIFD